MSTNTEDYPDGVLLNNYLSVINQVTTSQEAEDIADDIARNDLLIQNFCNLDGKNHLKAFETHSDSCIKLLDLINNLASNLTSSEASCELERSESWEFPSSFVRNRILKPLTNSCSTLSSLNSISDFYKILESYRSKSDFLNKYGSRSLIIRDRKQHSSVKRSHSSGDVENNLLEECCGLLGSSNDRHMPADMTGEDDVFQVDDAEARSTALEVAESSSEMPAETETMRSSTPIRLCRSSSVSLDRRTSRLTRCRSAPAAAKCAPSASWRRASMRFVQPFQLDDPPVRVPIPFPYAVQQPRTSMPRQHGRQFGRRMQRDSEPAIEPPPAIPPVVTNDRPYEMSQESENPLGYWNHGLSSMFACLGCTLGLFNISRFAIFSIQFGANFVLQFLVLTLLIGIPLFTFHISLGQLLGTGVLNMWYISPICKGLGIALLLSQALIGIYSIVGVSWMFVYLRDSFISKLDLYRWSEPFDLYGEDGIKTLKYNNGSYIIEQTIPDYFNGVVLQRRSFLKPDDDDLINIKFSVAFNLAIVWIIVFLSLSKGVKSYGKVVFVFSILPIFGITMVCTKLLGILPTVSKTRNLLSETDWSEFFLNSKSWMAAFTEVFLTWGVFGASLMQITSHNKPKHSLNRDATLVVSITLAVLLLSAFIGNICVQILEYRNFYYLPSSFEHSSTYLFLQKPPLPYTFKTTPIGWMVHSSFILGERTIKPDAKMFMESGYQPLRLATELMPAAFTAIGPQIISPFWSVLFYLVCIMFGIAQQTAIWYSVISGIVTAPLKPFWTSIAWFTCLVGFILGWPLASESGIFVIYYFDYVVGCGWWMMILYLMQLGAVFLIRGKPYSGEALVATLFSRSNWILHNWIAPIFSFNWNVILPVILLLSSTTVFKNGGYRLFYNWNQSRFYEYWPTWSRKLGCFLQLMPLCLVPLVGIIQSYRYLSNGPTDLFERIQMLYRPVLDNQNLQNSNLADVESNNRSNNNSSTTVINDDPPPKYTPPPSYSTATGARIAKLLRQSFRHSVRILSNALGASDQVEHRGSLRPLPPPPDYSTVLVEINQSVPILSPLPVIVDAQDGSVVSTGCGNQPILSDQECTSIQCLVESAAPINHDSIVVMMDELKTTE